MIFYSFVYNMPDDIINANFDDLELRMTHWNCFLQPIVQTPKISN